MQIRVWFLFFFQQFVHRGVGKPAEKDHSKVDEETVKEEPLNRIDLWDQIKEPSKVVDKLIFAH